MTEEHLEFSISQYADGTLPAGEIPALEAVLAEEPAARQLLEEYRGIDALLKSPAALPAIAWEKLSSHLSSAVADEAEQFEFQLSQYADGSLEPEQKASIEARLNEHAVQSLLQQDRRLTTLLKSAPLPAIHWDKLSAHLSSVIADAAEPPSIKLFPHRWMRTIGSLALAACVLLASSLGIHAYLAHRPGSPGQIVIGPNPTNVVAVANKPIDVQIGGPDAQAAPQGIAIAEITIGAGPGDDGPSYADGIVTTSPRSLIASNAVPEQDSVVMPY